MAYNVNFLKGTLDKYQSITKNKDTFYYVDDKDLYLGEIKLSNAEDITAAVSRISANEKTIQTILAELDALNPEGGGSITTQIQALRNELIEKIDDNSDAILAEKERAEGVEKTISEAAEKNATDIETIQQTLESYSSSLSTLGQEIQGAKDDLSDHLIDFQTLSDDVDDLGIELGNVSDKADSNESKLATLIGEDEGFSVRKIAELELAAQLIPENAQESLNTLKEIADWIQAHPGDASEMNTAIGKNTSDIAELRKDVNSNALDISTIKSSLNAINHSQTGILAQSQNYTDTQIEDAMNTFKGTLGTAAYKNVEFFDAAGSAAAALTEAKEYTDNALTWGIISE